MEYATCINESAYRGSLTYGQQYSVLAYDPDPQRPKIKIQADNGRVRWFPLICFDLRGAEVPRLHEVHIHDTIDEPLSSAIEVEVVLSNKEHRRCFFATPDALTKFGDFVHGTTIRVHCGMSDMIVVSTISEAIIEQTLHDIERQGRLFACTRPADTEE